MQTSTAFKKASILSILRFCFTCRKLFVQIDPQKAEVTHVKQPRKARRDRRPSQRSVESSDGTPAQVQFGFVGHVSRNGHSSRKIFRRRYFDAKSTHRYRQDEQADYQSSLQKWAIHHASTH